MKRLLDAPETNVAMFAFLLNLPWELVQVPLFVGMPEAQHWRGILACASAAVGDAAIALVAFWAVAAGGGRAWIKAPAARPAAAFVLVGVSITIVMERLGTDVFARWAYAESMPVLPLIEVGLSPVAQWVVIPLLVIWFVRRQLA